MEEIIVCLAIHIYSERKTIIVETSKVDLISIHCSGNEMSVHVCKVVHDLRVGTKGNTTIDTERIYDIRSAYSFQCSFMYNALM